MLTRLKDVLQVFSQQVHDDNVEAIPLTEPVHVGETLALTNETVALVFIIQLRRLLVGHLQFDGHLRFLGILLPLNSFTYVDVTKRACKNNESAN